MSWRRPTTESRARAGALGGVAGTGGEDQPSARRDSHRAPVDAEAGSDVAEAEPEGFAQPASLRPLILGEPHGTHSGGVSRVAGGSRRRLKRNCRIIACLYLRSATLSNRNIQIDLNYAYILQFR